MPFFNKNKKKLEEERQQRQRLEDELAKRERKENFEREQMKQQRRRLEGELAKRERKEKLQHEQMRQAHQREMEQAEQQLRSTRLAQEELKRREEERQNFERQKKGVEEKRLEREARQRQNRQRKIKQASPETLRSLRELIRLKYQLDVEIWGLRGARKPDRWLVEQKMEKADAVLEEIMTMVRVWEHKTDGSWDAAEWERVQDIRRRLQTGGIRIWADSPLWSEARDSGVYGRGSGVYRRETTV